MMDDLQRIGRDEESADLQHHAEVDQQSSAPFVVGEGDADSDIATQPQSRGLPAEEHVDRELGNARDSGRQPAADRSQPQSGETATEPNRASGGHEPVADGTGHPSTGPVDPVDPSDDTDPHSTGPVDPVDPSRDEGRTIDDDRPPHSRRRESGWSLRTEIFLGLLLGSVGAVIILFVVMYLYPIR